MKNLKYFILGMCVFLLMGTTLRPTQTSNTGQDRKNLEVIHVSDEDIDIDFEGLMVGGYYLTSGNLTVLTDAANGINSLDTGSMANSTWYYSWVIYNPSTDTTAGLASLSATAPTMPAGYTEKRRVGSFRTDGSADIIDFHMNGYGWFFYDQRYIVLSGGTSTAWAAIDFSTFMPPTSTRMSADASITDTGNSVELYFRATGDTGITSPVFCLVMGAVTVTVINTVDLQTDTSQSCDYQIGANDTNASVYIHGYLDNL